MNHDVQLTIAKALEPFAELFKIFAEAGFQLYAVGGCVRDWILGYTPKDIDFTTDAIPEQTKQILADHGFKVIPVGEAFGTIATLIHQKSYEITTFRVKESYTRGSRHPIVCFGKELERDLERRDLTINAMAADINGQIIDIFGGIDDLQNHILRVPRSSYDKTIEIFGDDPLRILRLARFKARLDFGVDPDATQAAADMADTILTVSHERWFAELDGLLRAPHPRAGLEWLREIQVLELILPELCLVQKANLRPKYLSCKKAKKRKKNQIVEDAQTLWEQTLERIECAPADGDLRWAALFSLTGFPVYRDDIGLAEAVSQMWAEDGMERLKFSNARIDNILKVMSVLSPEEPNYRTAREMAIFLGSQIADWEQFQEIRLATLHPEFLASERERLEHWCSALEPYKAHPETAEIKLPNGLSQKLTEALGVRGKTLGLCLSQCRDAVLDECLSESDDCDRFVDWVRDHYAMSNEL